jgi:hypothetical protein
LEICAGERKRGIMSILKSNANVLGTLLLSFTSHLPSKAGGMDGKSKAAMMDEGGGGVDVIAVYFLAHSLYDLSDLGGCTPIDRYMDPRCSKQVDN